MFNISVIIPTYNPQTYICDCLDSLYHQDLPFKQWEIIIILNGDVSKYEPIISSYLENKPQECNITFLCTKIRGVSNARNIGIENAKGEYICFIDDDDIISSSYLSALLCLATKNNMPICNVHSFKKNITEKGDNFFICKKQKNINKYNNASLFVNRSFLSFPVARIIHRDIINERRFDIRFKNGEDALFITTLTDRIDNLVFTDQATYYVRERIGSASRKKIPTIELIDSMFKLIGAYMFTYLKKPANYSLLLFLSRIPGVIKNTLLLARNK